MLSIFSHDDLNKVNLIIIKELMKKIEMLEDKINDNRFKN